MALKKLREHFQETNINEFQRLLNNRVMVVEKISAPSFYVRRINDKFEFYKSSNSKPLTIVDRTLMSLYEVAIKHIQSLNPTAKDQLPTDYKFGFEYLPETNVASYSYSKTPQSNLILTNIQQMTEGGKVKKTIIDPVILEKWSNILEVQKQDIIFDGVLDSLQKERLIKLLSMNDKEFSESYDYDITTDNETSFTKEIYKIFNPNSSSTVLQEDLEKEIDGLVLNFAEGKKIQSYKLQDFARQSINESRESSHMYQIAIADILEYFINYNFKDVQLVEENADHRYLELMSVVFNEYIEKNATRYVGVNFENAEFSKANSFKLNTNFIKNEKTLKNVSNEVLSSLFKITLGTFRKQKTKSSDILNDDMILQLNKVVDTINEIIFVENTDENSIYDYNNFMLHNKIKTKMSVNEALTVDHAEQGKELVNMFVGRFQPFTLGHAKVLEAIHKQNGYPVIVFLIKAKNKKKGDEFRKPYSEDLQIKMFKQVQKQYKFLKEIIVLDRGAIDYMFNALRPKYEPVLWGTGTDRMKSYGYQVNNDSYRDQLNVRSDFGLFEIPRNDNNISATQVRNALLDGDEKEFKKTTPKAIHKMYDVLKSELEKSMALVTASKDVIKEGNFMTFEQYMNKLKQ
ncbi:MAG: adenylyltransferase/cytidyltransferase family protein [Flavobacteriales bacterium]